jgi:hypothetical protein
MERNRIGKLQDTKDVQLVLASTERYLPQNEEFQDNISFGTHNEDSTPS